MVTDGYPDNSDSDPEGLNIVGQAHAVAAYATNAHGTPLPIALTETNWGMHNLTQWLDHSQHMQARTLKIARQILSMAAHPDKCLLRHMHDMSANAGGLFVFRSDPPNPTMLLYKLLKPLRGTRRAFGVSDGDGGATAEALAAQKLMLEAVGDGERTVVAVANFELSPRAIDLNVSALGKLKAVKVSCLDLQGLRNSSQAPPAGGRLSLDLPAGSVTVAEIQSGAGVAGTVQQSEGFAPEVFLPLANFTPSCSQQPPRCPPRAAEAEPPCAKAASDQHTVCTNTTEPLTLKVQLPATAAGATPVALLLRLGLLAKHYSVTKPVPNSTFLDGDIGRWRLSWESGAAKKLEFDGAVRHLRRRFCRAAL